MQARKDVERYKNKEKSDGSRFYDPVGDIF
jgi:hypothetical protein